MRKKVIVRAPVLSRSGYGEHARFLLRTLRSREDLYDIYLINTNWGQTSWIYEDTEERRWIDHIISKSFHYQSNGGQYDVSAQVTIPNEWEKLAPINIGITAGIETTKVAPVWLERGNMMDKIITISEHSKSVYEKTSYQGKHKETGELISLECETPINIVHYPVKSHQQVDLNIDFETDFNFLTVAQWGPRKNMNATLEWFIEEFIDKKIGLVVKTFGVSNSTLDKLKLENTLEQILSKYPERECKIYLIHGDMSEDEMHSLYNHPKIKCLVSLTHGEGFGLPMFEAAYSGLPVLAPDWSGYNDFLYMPIKSKSKKKKNKIKLSPMFAKVNYDLAPIGEEAVWEGVLQADSMWCFPQQGSYKMKLREVHKEYDRFKSQAARLQKWIQKEFSQENQYEKFINALFDDDTSHMIKYE